MDKVRARKRAARRSRLWRAGAVVAALSGLGVLVAACGGGQPNSVAHIGTTTFYCSSGRSRSPRRQVAGQLGRRPREVRGVHAF